MLTTRRLLGIALATAVLFAAPLPPRAQSAQRIPATSYTLVDLGYLPKLESSPGELNDQDEVIGYTQPGYTQGCIENSGGRFHLFSTIYENLCVAGSINNSGTIVGWSDIYDNTNVRYAFDKRATERIARPIVQRQYLDSFLTSLNDSGLAVGFYVARKSAAYITDAFYDGSTFIPFGAFARNFEQPPYGRALNSSGTVAVGEFCGNPLLSLLARPVTVSFGPPITFARYATCAAWTPLALNDAGQMLLNGSDAMGYGRAFVLQTGTPGASPEALPGVAGCPATTSYGPTSQDQAGDVVGHDTCAPTNQTGNWLYVPGSGTIDLDTLLPSGTLAKFQVVVEDLNDNGTFLFSGYDSKYQHTHWLLLKPSAALPGR